MDDAGNDSLYGATGNDTLQGGADADLLQGGGGRNALNGGAGADRFIFASAAEAWLGALRDRIMHFVSQEDQLNLKSIVAGQTSISTAPATAMQARCATILLRDVAGQRQRRRLF
jgi:Ca2+-binding RTX toxin-like protein